MHALSPHIVCLLVAQFAPDSGFQFDQPSPQSRVQSVEPAAGVPQLRQASATEERLSRTSAASETPTIPIHSQTSLARAEALVEEFIGWDPKAIEGESVTLLECLQRAANTGQQSATIKAYWQLCVAIGQHTQSERELAVLAGIVPQFKIEQSQIRAAQRSAEARRAQARVDLLTAQERLGEVARLPDETLPLPADRPFVGKYRTRLTTMYAGRAIPRQLRKIDRALPHQLKLIEQRADAVDASAQLMTDIAALYQQEQVPLTDLLRTCRELTNQRDAFLRAVVNYNGQIATYSQTVLGTSLPAESLVSTLIRQPSTAAPRVFRDNNVLPAAARQPELGGRTPVGQSPPAPAANVRPAFEPEPLRRSFEPRAPAADAQPAFDPNASFQINDGP